MLKNEKPKEVEKIKDLISRHKTVGLLNMNSLPGRQLHKIRNILRGKAIIKMSKKTLLKRAMEEKNIKNLSDRIVDEPALLLSNENPFKLFKIIKENRMPASAKVGDIATNDIVISKGPTPLTPGPAIATLQKVGLKTSVQNGKLAVMTDKTVAKAGDAITEDHVGVLSLLGIEPMEIGLSVVCVLEDGTIFDKDVLDVSVEDYLKDIENAVRQSMNLSLNTGYLTKETSPFAIQKAFTEAKSLCLLGNILEKDFIDEVLAKAVAEARALEDKIPEQETKETPKEEKNESKNDTENNQKEVGQ